MATKAKLAEWTRNLARDCKVRCQCRKVGHRGDGLITISFPEGSRQYNSWDGAHSALIRHARRIGIISPEVLDLKEATPHGK